MSFENMKLDPKILKGIKLMGFKEPTPIQEKCFKPVREGKDLVGQSLTGSGKTGAFGLPTLDRIVPGGGIQMLVLTPTRELCVQVRDALEEIGRFLPINLISIYGGVGYFPQVEGIKTAEVVVATPGRLLDHLARRNLNFNNIKIVIMDEADKMFEMGFEKDVSKILGQTPKKKQVIMFSATMPAAAQHIVSKYLDNPVFIKEQLHVDRSLLRQTVFKVRREDKFSLLFHLLTRKGSGPALVFCGTKREVDRIAKNLNKQKFPAMPVHGDLRQSKRQQAITAFKEGKIDVLIATDIAARGIDISHIEHVYNYDVPRQPEDYTHRIGRTARAGKKGEAITLLSDRDFNNFRKITGKGRMEIKEEQAPEFEHIVIKRDPRDEGRSSSYGRRDSYGGRGRGEKSHYGRSSSRDNKSPSRGRSAPRSRDDRDSSRGRNSRDDRSSSRGRSPNRSQDNSGEGNYKWKDNKDSGSGQGRFKSSKTHEHKRDSGTGRDRSNKTYGHKRDFEERPNKFKSSHTRDYKKDSSSGYSKSDGPKKTGFYDKIKSNQAKSKKKPVASARTSNPDRGPRGSNKSTKSFRGKKKSTYKKKF
jgi:superfamily II DNA/RNA helicase